MSNGQSKNLHTELEKERERYRIIELYNQADCVGGENIRNAKREKENLIEIIIK